MVPLTVLFRMFIFSRGQVLAPVSGNRCQIFLRVIGCSVCNHEKMKSLIGGSVSVWTDGTQKKEDYSTTRWCRTR